MKNRPLPDAARAHGAVLALSLDRDLAEPLHIQLGRQLRELILAGRIGRGARLPSSRALALELGISRATSVLAYDQLASEGYIEGRRGSGMFVSPSLPEHVLQVASDGARPATAPTPPRPNRPDEPASPDAGLPFQIGPLDAALFPHAEWARLLHRVWRRPQAGLLGAPDPFGWIDLRRAIAGHLEAWRGITCDAGQIVVTSGTADATDVLARIAFGPGSSVLVEEPGYPALRYALRGLGIGTVPVAVDGDGMDLQRAPRVPHLRGAVVTPSRQFPLGATLPLARRLALLDWAFAVGAYVVEDDFDSEYRYEGTPLPALMSLDRQGRAIYIGSFSKVLSPSLRLGFIVLPPQLVAPAREHLRRRGLAASLIAQPALAELIRSGEYARHIRRTRRIYARRMAAVMAEAPRLRGLLDLAPATAGMHIIADLAPRLAAHHDDRAVVARLADAGIRTQALADSFAGEPTRAALLIGFAGFSEVQLGAAARRLATCLVGMLPS